jgi:hypothetical protein
MKIRLGFVPNSSSASFVLDLTKTSIQKLNKFMYILDHLENEGWSHVMTRTEINGWTSMDNGELSDLCQREGIPIQFSSD